MALTDEEIDELTSDKRKKQISTSVNAYRERQKEQGRKQTPVLLTELDKEHMAYLKRTFPEIRNQGEAISHALDVAVAYSQAQQAEKDRETE
jgi:hypothetical protein